MRYAVFSAASALSGLFAVFVFGADAPPTDPITLFFQLGISGVVAVVVWLWQRDTARQRDRLASQLEAMIAAYGELKAASVASAEAARASAAASNEMTRMLEYRWPRGRDRP